MNRELFFFCSLKIFFVAIENLFMCFLYSEFVYFAYFIVIQISVAYIAGFVFYMCYALPQIKGKKSSRYANRVCDLYDRITSSCDRLISFFAVSPFERSSSDDLSIADNYAISSRCHW